VNEGRTAAKVLLSFAVSLVVGSGVLPSFSAVSQDGRRTASTSVDGSRASVVGNGFSAEANQCVLYSTLVYRSNGTGSQLQAGLVRCNGILLTGSCDDGHTFIERFDGSSYYCISGNSFTNGTAYTALVYRTDTDSSTMTASISGALMQHGGFGLSQDTRAYAWGEATGGTNCPEPSSGTFLTWDRRIGTTWASVNNSQVFHGGTLSGAPCWGAVSASQADGGFEVD
jgi:hypothetical protein